MRWNFLLYTMLEKFARASEVVNRGVFDLTVRHNVMRPGCAVEVVWYISTPLWY